MNGIRYLSGDLQEPGVMVQLDLTNLNLPDQCFDLVICLHVLAHISNDRRAMREIYRVLRPGGRLAILEFGAPRIPGIRTAYLWYFRHVLPRVGRLVSKHGEAYSYLPLSVMDFPAGDAFVRMLRTAGFDDVRHESLALGLVYLYIARKRAGDSSATY